jgi:hypothetical protein
MEISFPDFSMLDFFLSVWSLTKVKTLLVLLCWSLSRLFFCQNLVGSLIIRSLVGLGTLQGFFFVEVLVNTFFVKTLMSF